MSGLGFVVLHYRTIEDTFKCVNSILKSNPNSPIVVVDNGSNNDSGEKLEKVYRGNGYVYVLCLKENLGFAKGNNFGISYLRENFSLSFIVVLNNDTIIEQENILKIIKMEYDSSRFSVLGPQIINRNGSNTSNPVENIVDSRSSVFNLIFKRRIKLMLNVLHLDMLVHDVGTAFKSKGIYDNLKRYENVKLHGACWIFSDVFFERYNGLNTATFLYFEEDILYAETVKKGLKTVYNPEIVIFHAEDASTNSIVHNQREKNIFVLKNEIKSLRVLLKLLKE